MPARIVIVEGILIYLSEELRRVYDLKVFIDVEPDLRLIRRIVRDCEERGRDMTSVIAQYLSTVKPMHDKYVQSQASMSDIVLSDDSIARQQSKIEDRLRHLL